jgi:hypothetical protein
MIWHEHITAQQKTQPSPCAVYSLNQQRIFPFPKNLDAPAQVDRNEEDAIRGAQAVNVRHLPRISPQKPTVRKTLTVVTRSFCASKGSAILPEFFDPLPKK